MASNNVFVSKIISTADGKNVTKSENKRVISEQYQQTKSSIQADSLGNIGVGSSFVEDEQGDISVDFHDSLDESVSDNENLNSDNENDDARSDISGSSTSTESLIERSRKYLTDEAGIIILKTKKMPKTKENFNIILNFDVDGTNKEAQKLKIQDIHQRQQIDVNKYLEDQKNQYSIEGGGDIHQQHSGFASGLNNNNNVIIDNKSNNNKNFFDLNKIGVDNFNWDSIVSDKKKQQSTDTNSNQIRDDSTTQRYVLFYFSCF